MADGRTDEFELRALMTRYQSADARALDELVRRLSPQLFRFFSNSRFGQNDAEDMVQAGASGPAQGRGQGDCVKLATEKGFCTIPKPTRCGIM
jgi:hypothetical protein